MDAPSRGRYLLAVSSGPPSELTGPVGVVGAGLIGASVGLALKAAGVAVLLRDADPEQKRLAIALEAGQPWEPGVPVQHAVLAVPPHAVGLALRSLQDEDAAQTFSDVASVKQLPVADAVTLGCDLSTWCPAHPVAGRERGGVTAARADLFVDRPWVLSPTPRTGPDALALARLVATTCRASPVVVPPTRHDEAMARLSHVPQLVASLLAAAAGGLPSDDLALAGSGFRDTTRLADSAPGLWVSILDGNREPVAAALSELAGELASAAATLRSGTADDVAAAVHELMSRGTGVRRRLPAKPGQPAPDWVWVGVVVPDRPGELATLFAAVAVWSVNIEDVRVEHSREQPRGILELAVRPQQADALVVRLGAKGWTAYRRS